MTRIFVVSDTHFNHDRIRGFTNYAGEEVRPNFTSCDHMNETMIANWNSVVTPQDHVYHLGDVYFGKGKDSSNIRNILSRLHGHKRLILGNHDDGKDPILHEFFQKIMLWRMFPDLGVLLTHVPVHESTMESPKTRYNFHGHIHRNPNPSPFHLNCSVEMQNYTPKTLEQLLEQVKGNINSSANMKRN